MKSFYNNLEEPNFIISKDKNIYCPNCYSIALAKIIDDEYNKEIYINLICKNNHSEKLCNINLHANYLFYCFECSKIFCLNCKINHIKENKEHFVDNFVSKDEKCKLHNFEIKSYFCCSCRKNICGICIGRLHSSHYISNLKNKKNLTKIKSKSIIEETEI